MSSVAVSGCCCQVLVSVGVDVECRCRGCWCQVLMSSVGATKRCTWDVVEGVEGIQHLPLVSMLTLKDQSQLPLMFSLLIVNCKKQAARANISPRPAGWTADVRDSEEYWNQTKHPFPLLHTPVSLTLMGFTSND